MEYSDIINSARRKLLRDTSISNFSEGSIARELIELYAAESEETYTFLENKFTQTLLTEAEGTFLDQLGLLVGTSRDAAATSYGEVTFLIDPIFNKTLLDLKGELGLNPGDDIIFPTGTLVKNEEGTIIYSTTTDMTLTDSDVVVSVVASSSGSYYNAAAGQIQQYETDPFFYRINDFVIVKNDAPIETGNDSESDDNYRYRIINSFANAAKANEIAVRLACLSIPGVSNVYIKNLEHGIGTFGIYVLSESPVVSDGVITAVQETVNLTAAVGIRGVVSTPNYEAVHLQIHLYFEVGTSTADKDSTCIDVANIVVDHINNLDLGEDLIINAIIGKIIDSSTQIKNLEILLFGRGDYNKDTGIIEDYEALVASDQNIDADTKWVTNRKLTNICYEV